MGRRSLKKGLAGYLIPLALLLLSGTAYAQQNFALDFQQLNGPYVKDHMRLVRHPEVDEQFTVEFWMQADASIPFCATEQDPQGCWSTGNTWFFGNFIFDGHQNFEVNPGRDSFDIVVANSGRLKVVLDPGDSETDGTTDVVSDGLWHHVAVVREWVGTTDHRVRIYVDGDLDGEATYAGRDPLLLIFPYWGTERADWAGAGPADFPDYHGRIDEIRYWSVARTESQIEQTMGTELTGTEPGLTHYMRLNEGQGRLAHDNVSDNDGVFYNLQPGSWVLSGAPLTQQPGPDCGDGVQNQGELGVDCGGPCPPCPPLSETNCSDGMDEDFDGPTDCADPDCDGSPACQALLIESDTRDADYNPIEGVMLGNFYNRQQICIGDDGGRFWQMGLQFRVPVTPPVTVTAATITLTSSGDNAGSVTTEIRAVDQDDIAPFVESTQPSFTLTYPLTDAATPWTPPALAAGATIDTPDLRAAVQEVLDRPGWSSGSYMGFIFSEDPTPGNWRCYTDSFADNGNEARLTIDYYTNGTPVCLDTRGPDPELRVEPEPETGCPTAPGGPQRDYVFGTVSSLTTTATTIDPGPLRCIPTALATTEEVITATDPDPLPGETRFYLTRQTGTPDFGQGQTTQPLPRIPGPISCP